MQCNAMQYLNKDKNKNHVLQQTRDGIAEYKCNGIFVFIFSQLKLLELKSRQIQSLTTVVLPCVTACDCWKHELLIFRNDLEPFISIVFPQVIINFMNTKYSQHTSSNGHTAVGIQDRFLLFGLGYKNDTIIIQDNFILLGTCLPKQAKSRQTD